MKRIVIIGASSGLGKAIALDFARRGWRVGIAARREELLHQICAEAPDKIEYAVIDATASDAATRFLQLVDKIGGADVVLYAAGVGWSNPNLDAEKNLFTDDVNVLGFTRIVDAAYHYFSSRPEGGQIAAITSIAGTKGLGIAATYSATKRYQNTYLQCIGQLAHINGKHIAVTDIRPGFIRTDLLDPNRHYPMLMTVDYAAPRIVRAILRRRRVAVVDWRWNIVVGLWRLIPSWLWRLLPVKL